MNTGNPVLTSRTLSGTKELTGIALFSALAVVLSYIFIPAPYALFLQYEIWEIPIVIAFLMIGVRAGVTVAVVNTLVLFLKDPGALATGPAYSLAATLVMLLGIGLAHKALLRSKSGMGVLVAGATIAGMTTRTVVLTIVDYALLPYPPPVGFSFPAAALVPLLPLIALFNATLALYTIPIAYWVLRMIGTRYKFKFAFPLSVRETRNTLKEQT